MKIIILALVILGFARGVFAGETEIMYQTKAGENDLEFNFDYNSRSTDFVDSVGADAGKVKQTTMSLGVQYGMGISEMFAFTAGLGFVASGSGEGENPAGVVTAESEISGLKDIELGFSGRYDLGMSMLQWRANLLFALSDQEVETDLAATPTKLSINGASGKTSLDMDLIWGYKLTSERMAGVTLKSELYATEASQVNTVKNNTGEAVYDLDGGGVMNFGLFYESTNSKKCVWGVALTMASKSEVEAKDNTDAVVNGASANAKKSMDLDLYSSTAMGSGSLLFGFTYSMVQSSDAVTAGGNETDGGSGMALNVGWRMGL